MRIQEHVWRQLADMLGNAPVESGAILGRRKDTVCAFFLDPRGGKEQYCPDTRCLNRVLRRWAKEGIAFAGLAHSHPNGVICLSHEDMQYAERIAHAVHAAADDTLYFPVVSLCDGKMHIAVHALQDGVWREESAERANEY